MVVVAAVSFTSFLLNKSGKRYVPNTPGESVTKSRKILKESPPTQLVRHGSRVVSVRIDAYLLCSFSVSRYTRWPYNMYPIPSSMSIYSPAVTAGGGVAVKKNFAWSAGAVRKLSAASTTAKTPASFGLRRNSETSAASGSNNPTIIKNPENHRVRSSFIRVSNPNGVNRNPTIKPTASKTANTFSALLKEANSISPCLHC